MIISKACMAMLTTAALDLACFSKKRFLSLNILLPDHYPSSRMEHSATSHIIFIIKKG